MLAAATTAQACHISYWDAAVVEAARALGCASVLTEDLADGRDYGGVRIENPFRTAARYDVQAPGADTVVEGVQSGSG